MLDFIDLKTNSVQSYYSLIYNMKNLTKDFEYCRTHNVSVCLYIAYIACGPASLYVKTLYFFLTVLALSAAATVANIKIRYNAKIPQFAIFGTRVIYVFYSIPVLIGIQLTSVNTTQVSTRRLIQMFAMRMSVIKKTHPMARPRLRYSSS